MCVVGSKHRDINGNRESCLKPDGEKLTFEHFSENDPTFSI